MGNGIKQAIHKFEFDDSVEELGEICKSLSIEILPIELKHIERTKTLPFIHNDPFDRLLIAQAIENDLTLITKDAKIPQYNVKTLW